MADSAELGIDTNTPVADVMRRWPATLPVFVGRRMACPGCPMAGFMTVDDAARSYNLDPGALLGELRRAARRTRKGECG